MPHLLDVAPIPSPLPSGCSCSNHSQFQIDTLQNVRNVIPDSLNNSIDAMNDSLSAVLPIAGGQDGGTGGTTMLIVMLAIVALILWTVFGLSKSSDGKKLNIRHTLPSILMGLFLLPFMTGCDFIKGKPEKPLPNIDSLVDVKVEQRMKEKAAADAQQLQKADPVPVDEVITEDLDDDDFVEDDFDDIEESLEGHIGPYTITMNLDDLDDAVEGDYAGYYYYNDRPQSKFRLRIAKFVAINAKGSMDLVLKEYSPQGAHTGTFNGQYECRGDYYAGTFTNSKGQKFKFEVR